MREAPKVESAIGDVLPKKRGRPRKEEQPEEFVGQNGAVSLSKKSLKLKLRKKNNLRTSFSRPFHGVQVYFPLLN